MKIQLMIISLVAVLGLQGSQNDKNALTSHPKYKEQELLVDSLLTETKDLKDRVIKLNQQISNKSDKNQLGSSSIETSQHTQEKKLNKNQLNDEYNAKRKEANIKRFKEQELVLARLNDEKKTLKIRITEQKQQLSNTSFDKNQSRVEINLCDESGSFKKSQPSYLSISALKTFFANHWGKCLVTSALIVSVALNVKSFLLLSQLKPF